jgi:hypothetical protein
MIIKSLTLLLTFSLLLIACKENVSTNKPVAEANTNKTSAEANSNNQKAEPEKPDSPSSDKVFSSLETPKDTFKSHYAALAANNEELLKKTLSSGMLSLYKSMMPDKKIVEMMREMLKKQGESTNMPEIVSEKINGSEAVIKWKASDGTIVDQPLVKEKDGWKMQMGK